MINRADATRMRGETFYRKITLDRAGLNEEERTVPASLSSEIEVERFFGKEVLVHENGAVNLERAKDGLPLLFGHNQDQPIGLVEDVRVEDDKLRGMLRFSKNQKATEIWQDIDDGFLKNISIGYRVNKWEERDDSDVVRVTRWTLYEASVVSVPADHSVGVNRSQKEIAMSEHNETAPAPTETRSADEGINVVAFKEATKAAREEGARDARKEGQRRIRKIRELFLPFDTRAPIFAKVRDELIAQLATEEQARTALYELWASGDAEPIARDYVQDEGSSNGADEQVTVTRTAQGRRTEQIKGGKDAIENYRDGVTAALTVRVQATKDEKLIKEAAQSEYLSMGPVELAREYLRHTGVTVRGLSRERVIGLAIETRGLISHSTSDFANILEDVANKSLQIGYSEAEETWSQWCRTGNIPDFRQANRPNLSAFGDLDIVYEDGEYKYGSFSDLKEVLTLVTYGKMFSISRQALVNDDLDALGRIPASMGRAAARKVGDLAYAVLTSNPTMNQDATALFAAGHSNLVAGGSGAAPSVATVEAARTAMATQTDPSGNAILNVRPRFLLVPFALEGTARTIAMAEYDPAGTAGTLTPNTVRNTFEVIADGRLDASDPAAWFMAADPAMIETIEVAFLDGQTTPYMESQNGWSTDGVTYKVRIDAVAAPLDFRGLYMNDGN